MGFLTENKLNGGNNRKIKGLLETQVLNVVFFLLTFNELLFISTFIASVYFLQGYNLYKEINIFCNKQEQHLTFLSVFSVKNLISDSMPLRMIETVCSDSSVSEMKLMKK